MQHLFNENTYENLDFRINNKIQLNILRFPRQHKMCFIEIERKCLNLLTCNFIYC